ncbi:MAG TPA: ABC transporter ATP-binding protein [Alphaproteobacteria bacterium]|nr:ABC transporter ATP-binding protein [Alphaproteobacteria bacterium]
MTMLSVRGLSLAFGGIAALSEVSFEVAEGEIVGVIGPNGAGKTTLLNTISGLSRANQGEIRLAGISITGRRPTAIARLGLGRTFQLSQLFPGMTVLENVMTGLHRGTRAGPFAAAFRTRRMRAEEEASAAKAWQALSYVGMERFAHRPGSELSFGQQRIVEIARTLVGEPKLVLLDEPAVGLSLTRVAELDRLLRRIRDERGVTFVMIEHVVRLVMEVCDRVIVLNYGVKIADGRPAEVTANRGVIAAYLGSGFDAAGRAS